MTHLEVSTWHHSIALLRTMLGFTLQPCAYLCMSSLVSTGIHGQRLRIKRTLDACASTLRMSLTGPCDLSWRAWLKYARPMQQRWSFPVRPVCVLSPAAAGCGLASCMLTDVYIILGISCSTVWACIRSRAYNNFHVGVQRPRGEIRTSDRRAVGMNDSCCILSGTHRLSLRATPQGSRAAVVS